MVKVNRNNYFTFSQQKMRHLPGEMAMEDGRLAVNARNEFFSSV